MISYLGALFSALLVLIAHLSGIKYGLYVLWDPYDIFMHLLGGFAIGIFIYALSKRSPFLSQYRFSSIIVGVLAAGILWEAFETYYHIAGYPVGTPMYWIDSVKDLVDDVVGGFVIALLTRSR